MKHAPRFVKIAKAAKANVQECNVHDLNQKISNGDKFYLVDVREENEWNNGHIPNAIHLSKGIIERDIEKDIPDINAEIYLYCGGGFRSAMSADNLQQMGYTNVTSVDGGMRAWYEAGFETE